MVVGWIEQRVRRRRPGFRSLEIVDERPGPRRLRPQALQRASPIYRIEQGMRPSVFLRSNRKIMVSRAEAALRHVCIQGAVEALVEEDADEIPEVSVERRFCIPPLDSKVVHAPSAPTRRVATSYAGQLRGCATPYFSLVKDKQKIGLNCVTG